VVEVSLPLDALEFEEKFKNKHRVDEVDEGVTHIALRLTQIISRYYL
jgi:hypothetical protein